MRIYSKKSFALGPGARANSDVIEQIVTTPFAFQDIPDEYANDNMFKLAIKSGDITVVSTPVSVDVNFTADNAKENAENFDEVSKEEEFRNKLKLMNADEVKELAKEYGAVFNASDRLGENKKRVFEAYKIEMKYSDTSADTEE